MATPSTADFSESFAHLTLDNTDKLSSTDEISVHSLQDLQAFLDLARKHDNETNENEHGHEFQSAAISSHLTPLIRNNNKFQRRDFLTGSMGDSMGVSKGTTTGNSISDNRYKEDGIANTANKTDAAALFKTLQPFIDEHLARYRGRPFNSTNYSHHRLDLDGDLKVDDTFDKLRRPSIESNRPSSPLTTPPQSSESRFTDSKGTFVDEDLCRPITNEEGYKNDRAQTQKHWNSQMGNKGMQAEGNESLDWLSNAEADVDSNAEVPQLELPDLTTHEIDLGAKNLLVAENTIAKLRMELEQYKQQNSEMINELQFLRRQVEDQHGHSGPTNKYQSQDIDQDNEIPQNDQDIQNQQINQDQSTPNHPNNLLDTSKPIRSGSEQLHEENSTQTERTERALDASSIPEEFRPYYHRLQLDKVETLTSEEKSNLIKRIMLSLLVSDYDHLSSVMPQVGSYLRLTSKFLDNLHLKLYYNNEIGPLRYLQDYNLHTDDGLEECLDGMFNMLM